MSSRKTSAQKVADRVLDKEGLLLLEAADLSEVVDRVADLVVDRVTELWLRSAGAAGAGTGSLGVRSRITKQRRDRLFNLQAESVNRSGRARTADHRIVPPSERRPPVRGKGRWKCWTAEATLRAGFGAEVAGQRDVAQQIEGAGHGPTADARYVVSEVAMSRQVEGLRGVGQVPLDFFIRNIMWDETSFDLTWDKSNAAVTQSVLCSHVQVSYRVAADAGNLAEDNVRDEHTASPARRIAGTRRCSRLCHAGIV